MPHVTALYRYPVKGFTGENCDVLTVLNDGRIAGDRVLGIRFASSTVADKLWGKKHEFVALVNTPGLACLTLQFDHKLLKLRVNLADTTLVEEALDDKGRKQISMAIEEYILQLDINPLASHTDRLPLRVVGDGMTSRFQDSEAGQITLHSNESLVAVASAIGSPNLNGQRFRSNIVIEGLEHWEEQNWIGRKIRIGKVNFNVVEPKTRCLAIQANPLTGKRDLPILKTLTHSFNQKKPTFAIAMTTHGVGGEIYKGDKVELVD